MSKRFRFPTFFFSRLSLTFDMKKCDDFEYFAATTRSALIRISNGTRNLLLGLFPLRPFALNFASQWNQLDNEANHIIFPCGFFQLLITHEHIFVVNLSKKWKRRNLKKTWKIMPYQIKFNVWWSFLFLEWQQSWRNVNLFVVWFNDPIWREQAALIIQPNITRR